MELDPSSNEALQQYWRFFEPRAQVVMAGLSKRSESRPDWGPIFALPNDPPSPGLALQRAAILEGDWQGYLDGLRERGRVYATANIPYSSWFDLVVATRNEITRVFELDNAAFDGPQRRAIEDGMRRMFDIATHELSTSYLEAKEQLAHDRYVRLEEQIQHTRKMEALGQLAGSVAHDFNNILTVIKTNACFIEEAVEQATPTHTDIVAIRRAAERATAITRQLLTLGRRAISAPRAVSIDDIVADFAPLLRRMVGETVKLAIPAPTAPIPRISIDPVQLEQVMMNLAVNARDAMAAGGRLTIETHRVELGEDAAVLRGLPAGEYVELAMTDTGAGIPPDVRARMFDPFYTTKEAGKGTGLGLAIVHGIVTQARGAVMVYSEIGHGTTFRLCFPALPASASPSASQPVAAPIGVDVPEHLPSITVLVVDDHDEVRAVAVRALRTAGCQVVEASTAEEARRACLSHEQQIEVILLDVVLTDGRGDTLIKQLADLRPEAKVVLMSGYPAGALIRDDLTLPEVLPKPFSPTELRGAIARACVRGHVDLEPPDVVARRKRRTRILIAEDDALFRKVVVRVLEGAGYEVVAVGDGRQALDALSSGEFEAIVSDVQMPNFGGIDLLREVRRVDLDVPMILMSAAPSIGSATKAIEYGAFRYLIKPFALPELVKLVGHATRARALARIRREAHAVGGSVAAAADRAGIEVRFEQALAALWMAFQPIVDTKGVAYGSEALMRSSEPSMASPDLILDAAGQLQRIPILGRRVRALAAQGVGDGYLFVNLHPEDLLDAELLDEHAPLGKIASRVVLEVTERAALTSSPELANRVARLRALGFRLAIDDIGAGYSGLTSFTEIMPEIVKIDMSLVRDVQRSVLKQRTISALCSLCHEVGSLVVGEGVETIDEQSCLVDLGCDLLQGYLIGRPARRSA